MEKYKKGDKMYLDLEKTKESSINKYLECRDGIVEVYEYNDMSGYGANTRLFLCQNTKHEAVSVIRHIWLSSLKEWREEEMNFDSDSFLFLKAIINGKTNELGGKYSLVRDY
jgi:hypothetical protein